MATKDERRLLATNRYGPSLKLTLNQATKRTTIAKALFTNDTIKTVSLFVEGDFMTDISPESLRNLFRAIGSLPITSLYIYSYDSSMDIFPVQLIGDILRVAFRLEVLECYFLELGGGKISFDKFQDDLIEHPSLKEIKFANCQLSNRMLETHSITDKFLEALASLPNLEKLELSACEKGYLGTITPPYLEHLAGTTDCLTSLNLINFVLDNDHMSALNRALRQNKDLTELAISVNSEINGKLPALLATTKRLENLKLQFDSVEDEHYLLKIAKGVEKSANIARFELVHEAGYLSPKCQKTFAGLPEKNANIVQLDVVMTDRTLRDKVAFFTDANSDGTRAILDDPKSTRNDILDAMSRADMDMVDEFLCARPDGCPV